MILLDLKLPDVDGIDGLIRLRRAAAGIPVVVVSSLSDDRMIASVLRAGAAGFIPKHSQRSVFVEAFDRIRAGGVYTPEGYLEPTDAAGDLDDRDAVERMRSLTQQQARILELVCEGKLNKQIAYELDIAETTVKAHLTAILRKLHVQSRTQAVLIAQNARFAAILHPDAEPGTLRPARTSRGEDRPLDTGTVEPAPGSRPGVPSAPRTRRSRSIAVRSSSSATGSATPAAACSCSSSARAATSTPIAAAAAELFPGTPAVGCTTAGEICSDGYVEDEIVAVGFPAGLFAARTALITGLRILDPARSPSGPRGCAPRWASARPAGTGTSPSC